MLAKGMMVQSKRIGIMRKKELMRSGFREKKVDLLSICPIDFPSIEAITVDQDIPQIDRKRGMKTRVRNNIIP